MILINWPGLGPALTPKALLEFINADGNVLLTLSADSPTPSAISSLLLELDIQLPQDKTTLVVDHFNYDTLSAAEKHDVLLLPRPDTLKSGAKNFFAGSNADELIAFPRGVGQSLGNESPLITPILGASRNAYSYNPKEEAEAVEDPFAVGKQLSLVSAMQARNSARFTIVGSVEMLEDAWFDAKVKSSVSKNAKKQSTANREFAKEVSAWTFQEIGVLKIGSIEHYLSESIGENYGNSSARGLGEVNPKIYRVKNDVVSK
jgi:oligosaccharyltransferase complex subunit beta